MDRSVATSTSPLRGTAAVAIDADAATVYALVSDVTGYGRFSPENRGATWIGGSSGPVVGAGFRSWNRHGVWAWFTHGTVAAREEDRVFAFDVTFPRFMTGTRWTYRLEPMDDDRIWLEESWELPRPLGPARRMMLRLVLGVRDRPASLTAGAAETVARIRDAAERADP